jgi:hypothetical protein
MKILKSIWLILFMSCSLFGQSAGKDNFFHLQSGRTYGGGHLEIFNQSSFYTANVTEPIEQPTPAFTASSYWMVQNNLSIIYGPVDHFDLILKMGFYQDAHYLSDFNFPDAVTLTLKGGSLSFANRHLYAAAMINFTIPSGDVHNYPLVEYLSSSKSEYGFKTALSYYDDTYAPDNSFSVHLNLGYYSHNAASTVEYTQNNMQLESGTNGVEIQYGFGFVYPFRLVEFRFELSGSKYTQQPDTMVYGREDYLFATPSIRYKPLRWLSIDLGADFRVSRDEEQSSGIYLYSSNMGLPNYNDWRAHLGLNFTIFPLPPAPKSEDEIRRENFDGRIDYFRNMVESRDRVENAREDIEAIKKERKQIEREIKSLKQTLEEQG